MNAIAIRSHRHYLVRASAIGLVLLLILIGGVVAFTVMRDDTVDPAVTAPAVAAPDATDLALDRDGADLLSPIGAAPDTTTLNLDRDGADFHSSLTPDVAIDTTGIRLDRDGADLFPSALPVESDRTVFEEGR